MTTAPPDQTPEGWSQKDTGDWTLYRAGKTLGTVVSQDVRGRRTWYSVSAAAGHGPEAGGLTVCKRRIEALWPRE